MALYEVLVMAEDKARSGDIYKDASRERRGDVVTMYPAGTVQWGRKDLSLPIFRIIRIELTDEQVRLLREPEQPTDQADPERTLQYRGWFIDLDDVRFPGDLKANVLDRRVGGSVVAETLRGSAALAIKRRSRIQDPAVFG